MTFEYTRKLVEGNAMSQVHEKLDLILETLDVMRNTEYDDEGERRLDEWSELGRQIGADATSADMSAAQARLVWTMGFRMARVLLKHFPEKEKK